MSTRPRSSGRRTILSPAPGLSGWRRWRRDPGESGVSNLHTPPETLMDQRILRLLIQEKLADGRLPHDPFPNIRSRQGNGETCDGCEGTVARAQMLMEILDARGCQVQVHVGCYYLWVVERQAYGREPSVRLPARSGFTAPDARLGRPWAPRAPAARPAGSAAP